MKYGSTTLDESSLATEPKFGHGVGNTGIRQLKSEFKSIAYDVRCCRSTLQQCSPIARRSKCLDPESRMPVFQIIRIFRFTK